MYTNDAPFLFPRGSAPMRLPVHVTLLEAGEQLREEQEAFIAATFARAYGARVVRFMPSLMGLRSEDGELLAALGLRHAAKEQLFLEHYLDAPVEEVLATALSGFGAEPTREHLVEVGNLAARGAGGTRWLIIALSAYLQGAGQQWVVFTATPALRNSFRRLGLRLIHLGSAPRERLPLAEQAHWGTYYDGGPEVVAVNVPHTFGVLERSLRLERALHALGAVWQGAYSVGAAHIAKHHRPQPVMEIGR